MKKITILVIFLMLCVTCFSQITNTDGASASATIITPIAINQKEDKGNLVFEFSQDFYYETLVISDTVSTIVNDKNKLYIKKEKNQTIIINYN